MENMPNNMDEAKNKVEELKNQAPQAADKTANKVADAVKEAKDKLPEVTPTPPGLKAQSSAQDLKSRLEWGEPAFTIIDVRDRMTFNDGHIMGSMCMSMDQLVNMAQSSLEPNRDIYVYGETDEESSSAASQLRQAGFQCVAELKGGLAAWKAVGGPTEGISESMTPTGSEDYNVVSQLKKG